MKNSNLIIKTMIIKLPGCEQFINETKNIHEMNKKKYEIIETIKENDKIIWIEKIKQIMKMLYYIPFDNNDNTNWMNWG